jgi:hypothetical protein
MKNQDYYTIMEKRIKYLENKYDPLNRYKPEIQDKEEMSFISETMKKKDRKKSVLQLISSLLF